MVETYVKKLIENLPNYKGTTERLDLVLDGGAFNGSYLVGALYFLKEMERKEYVKIERISGCSIGAVCGLLYYLNSLDKMEYLYDIINKEFKTTHYLSEIKNLKRYLVDRIPDDICDKINGRLYICYNDIKRRKKIVRSKYKNVDDLIGAIIRSCYIPVLIDNSLAYKGKYIDGINAYIFKTEKNKKILHMELFSYDKFIYALNVKNENTNIHRVLTGMLDIHSFFMKQSSTTMCSYVDDWSTINTCKYHSKIITEYVIIHIIYLIYYLKKFMPTDMNDNIFIKMSSKICFVIFSVILETYFI